VAALGRKPRERPNPRRVVAARASGNCRRGSAGDRRRPRMGGGGPTERGQGSRDTMELLEANKSWRRARDGGGGLLGLDLLESH
jgi:hypothetical protein